MRHRTRQTAKAFTSIFMALVLFVGQWAAAFPRCEGIFETSPEIRRTLAIQDAYQAYRNSDGWWKSHMLYLQHLKVFREFAKEVETLDETSHPELKNERAIEVYKRMILHPEEPLSAKDIGLISSQKSYQSIFKGLTRSLVVVEFQYRVLQRLGQYWEGPATHVAFAHEKSWSRRALSALRAFYNGPIRFLVPVGPLPRIKSPVDRILEEQFKDPNHQLTQDERATLRQLGAEKVYQEKQDFMRSRPTWTKIRKWVRGVAIGAMALNSALAANWALHLSDPKAFVAAEKFFAEEQYRLAPNQVRVYNETAPFPHMAIEIDDRVYSYGQSHMTATSAREYLLSQDISRIVQEQQNAQTPKTLLTRALETTGLNKISRSVQMVTLNLTGEEKGKLKRDLELATGSQYRNHTLVLDCATMIVNALKRNTDVYIPEAIDASPSGVLMFLGALKSFEVKGRNGEPIVGDVRQVAMGATDQPVMHLLRNTYINAMEGKIFLALLPSNSAQRAYFDLRYGQEGFQFWNPEVRAELLSWQKSTAEELSQSESGRQLDIILERAKELGSTPSNDRDDRWASRASELRQVTDYYVDQEIRNALSVVQAAVTPFGDILRNAYRHDLLEGYKAQINAALDGRAIELPKSDPNKILDAVKQGAEPYKVQQ